MSKSPLLVFHDTSILINFHRASLLPKLGEFVPGRATWGATIRIECEREERQLQLPGLVEAADSVLGLPMRPEDREHSRIRQLRQLMASPGDHPDEHLGEAETIAIIEMRSLRAILAADDKDAARIAAPTPTLDTWGLARLMFQKEQVLTISDCLHLQSCFVDAKGRLPHRAGDRARLIQYVQSQR